MDLDRPARSVEPRGGGGEKKKKNIKVFFFFFVPPPSPLPTLQEPLHRPVPGACPGTLGQAFPHTSASAEILLGKQD